MKRDESIRRRIALQIRVVRVLYRGERERGEAESLQRYREAAATILDSLDSAAAPYADLVAGIEAARAEITGQAPS